MSLLADLLAQLRLDASDFVQNLNTAVREFVSGSQEMENASTQLQGATSGMFDGLKNSIASSTPAMTDMGKGIRDLGIAFAAGGYAIEELARPLLDVSKEAVNLAGNLQIGTGALDIFFGSAEKTQAVLEGIRGVESKSLFDFPQLLTSTQRMAALRIEADKIPGILQAAANSATALGGTTGSIDGVVSALSRIEVTGQLSKRALLVLGISWDDIAKQMGVSAKSAEDQMSKGLLGAAQTLDITVSTMNTKFGGMAGVIEGSLPKALKDLKDVWDEALTHMGEALTPSAVATTKFFEGLVSQIEHLVSAFASLPGPIQTMLIGIVAIGPAFGIATKVFGLFLSSLGEAIESIPKIIAALGPEGLGATLVSLGPILLGVTAAIATVAAAWALWQIPDVQTAIIGLWDTVRSMGEDFVKTAEAMIGSGLKAFWEDLKTTGNDLRNSYEQLKDAFHDLRDAVTDFNSALGPLSDILPLIGKTLEAVAQNTLRSYFEQIIGVVSLTVTGLKEFVDFVKTGFLIAMTLLTTEINGVTGAITDLLNLLSKIPGVGKLFEGIAGTLQDWKSKWAGMFDTKGTGLDELPVSLRKTQESLENLLGSFKAVTDGSNAFSGAAAAVIKAQEDANEKVIAAKAAYDELNQAYKEGRASQDDVKRAWADYNKAVTEATVKNNNYKDVLTMVRDVETTIASAIKTGQVPAMVALADATDTLNTARLNQAVAISKLQDFENQLLQVKAKGVPLDTTIVALQEKEAELKANLAQATTEVQAREEDYNKSKQNTIAINTALATAEKEYVAGLKTLTGPALLSEEQAMTGVSAASVQLAQDLADEKRTMEDLAAAQSAGAAGSKEAAQLETDLAGIRKRLTEDTTTYKDAVSAKNDSESTSAKIVEALSAAEEQLQKVYEAALPDTKTLAQEADDLRLARVKVAEAVLAETDAMDALSAARDKGDVTAINKAEKDLAKASADTSKAVADESQKVQQLSTDYGVTAEAAKGITTTTDTLKKASEDAAVALSALGLTGIPKLQAAASQAAQYYIAIASNATSSAYQINAAAQVVAKANESLFAAQGNTQAADAEHNRLRQLQQDASDLADTIPSISAAYKGLGLSSVEDLKKIADASKEMADRINGDVNTTVEISYQATKKMLEDRLKWQVAAGQLTGPGEAADTRRALDDLEKIHEETTHKIETAWKLSAKNSKDAWTNFTHEVTTIINDLGKGIATKIVSMFHDTTNSDLDKQAADLQKSLDQRTAEWVKYQADTAAKASDLTATNATELATQLADLQKNLDDKQKAYDAFAADTAKQITDAQATSATETAATVADLQSKLKDKEDAYNTFYQDVQEKLQRFQQDNAESLNNDLQSLKNSLRDKTQTYDDYVSSVNDKLAQIGQDTKNNIAQQTKDTQRGMADKKTAYSRDEADILKQIDQLTKEHKAGYQDQVAALQESLRRKAEDLATYNERASQDLQDYVAQQQDQESQQTDALKTELAQRTRDQQEFIADNKAAQDQAIADHAQALARETADQQAALDAQKADLEKFRADTQTNIDDTVNTAKANLDKQIADLEAALAQKKADLDQAKTDEIQAASDAADAAKKNLDSQLADLNSTLADQKAAYDQYVTDTEAKLKELEDQHKTIWGNILEFLTGKGGVFDQIGEAAIRLAIKPYTDALAKITTDAMKGIGIPGVGGSIGGSGGGPDTSIPSVPSGGGISDIGSSGGGGAASGIGTAITSAIPIVNLVSGITSAVGAIGGWIESIRQEGTMNAMEQELKVISMTISGIAKPEDTAKADADTLFSNIRNLRWDFSEYHRDFNGWYRDFLNDTSHLLYEMNDRQKEINAHLQSLDFAISLTDGIIPAALANIATLLTLPTPSTTTSSGTKTQSFGMSTPLDIPTTPQIDPNSGYWDDAIAFLKRLAIGLDDVVASFTEALALSKATTTQIDTLITAVSDLGSASLDTVKLLQTVTDLITNYQQRFDSFTDTQQQEFASLLALLEADQRDSLFELVDISTRVDAMSQSLDSNFSELVIEVQGLRQDLGKGSAGPMVQVIVQGSLYGVDQSLVTQLGDDIAAKVRMQGGFA